MKRGEKTNEIIDTKTFGNDSPNIGSWTVLTGLLSSLSASLSREGRIMADWTHLHGRLS